jgi:hypothetical protein
MYELRKQRIYGGQRQQMMKEIIDLQVSLAVADTQAFRPEFHPALRVE